MLGDLFKLYFKTLKKATNTNEIKKAIERQKQRNYIIEQQYKELKNKENKE